MCFVYSDDAGRRATKKEIANKQKIYRKKIFHGSVHGWSITKDVICRWGTAKDTRVCETSCNFFLSQVEHRKLVLCANDHVGGFSRSLCCVQRSSR